MILNDPRLVENSVVQINPKYHLGEKQGFFAGCLMTVTEVRPWGAIGYILVPHDRGEYPGMAYYRARWSEMEYVGKAVYLIGVEEA